MATEAEAQRKRRRRIIQTILGIVISGSLLALLISQLDTKAALERVKEADGNWILASFGMGVLLLLSRAARFRLLTQRSGLTTVAAAISVQTFINRVAPFRLGELSLPYFLHRSAGEPPVPALVSLVLVRLLELWVLLLFAAVAVVAWFGADEQVNTIGIFVGAGILTIMLFSFRIWVRWGARLATRIMNAFGLGKMAFLAEVLERVEEAVMNSERQTIGHWAMLMGTSVLVFLFTVGTYDCLLRAVDLHLSPMQIIIGVTFAMVAGAIPVTSVGSFGTHETGWTAGFMWVGLSLNDALVTGLITQVMTLVFNVILAVPGHLYLLKKTAIAQASPTADQEEPV
jgi:hypothetical protein